MKSHSTGADTDGSASRNQISGMCPPGPSHGELSVRMEDGIYQPFLCLVQR